MSTHMSVMYIKLPQNNRVSSLVQGNKIIALTLSMNIRRITPWSVNVIALLHTDTVIFLVQINKLIHSLSMDVRIITGWSLIIIALTHNNTITSRLISKR